MQIAPRPFFSHIRCFWMSILAILLLGLGPLQAENPGHKQVLILHSYHLGYVWTSNVHGGILSVLRSEGANVDLRTEYLDWKHFPTQQNLDRQFENLKAKYAHHAFDLLIATDNKATDFLLAHRQELFPGVPMVFCGYNGFDPALLHNQPGVTGAAEIVDGSGTLDIALNLLPDSREVWVICDATETGKAVRREVEQGLSRNPGRLQARFLGESESTEEVLAKVAQAPTNALILAGPFNLDRQGRFLDLWELADLMRERGVRAPVFHLYEEALGHGVLGGRLMSGWKQGEAAGRMAFQVLSGVPPEQIPPLQYATVRDVVDYREMEHRGIAASRIPGSCDVLNPPRSYYERYRTLLLVSLILSLGATLGLSILLFLRFQTERSLRRSEARLKALIEHMPLLACAFDPQGALIVWNHACERSTGYTAAEVLSQSGPPFIREESWQSVLRIARGEHAGAPAELQLRDKRGDLRTIQWFSESGLYPIQGWAGWAVGIDITQQLVMEEQARRSQRMDSLGALAGGMAHDFGNLMTTIQLETEVLESKLEGFGTATHHLSAIQATARRGSDLVKHLLGFARSRPAAISPVDVHEIMEELCMMLGHTLPKQIRIHRDLKATSPILQGDASQILQVLMNLALNARDAMPQGGVLTLGTSNAEDHLWITVQDTGCGMSPAVRTRIFEPFFSTKGEQGTGMGLAMTYTLVRSHGGEIQVESAPGEGTTFRLSFPTRPEATIDPDPSTNYHA